MVWLLAYMGLASCVEDSRAFLIVAWLDFGIFIDLIWISTQNILKWRLDSKTDSIFLRIIGLFPGFLLGIKGFENINEMMTCSWEYLMILI